MTIITLTEIALGLLAVSVVVAIGVLTILWIHDD
jgi:hypothetical protein